MYLRAILFFLLQLPFRRQQVSCSFSGCNLFFFCLFVVVVVFCSQRVFLLSLVPGPRRLPCELAKTLNSASSLLHSHATQQILSSSIGPPRAVALYPLNSRTQGRDIGPRKNKPARLTGVRLAPGPDGFPRGSIYFSGWRGSFAYFPNNGGIDTRNAITILVWIKPEKDGPIFHYNTQGSGVSVRIVRKKVLYVKFVRRSGKGSYVLKTVGVRPRVWNYFGVTYDGRTGLATIWRESTPLAQGNIGRGLRLATNYPAIMGSRSGSNTYFRGSIACLQVFDLALNGLQIRKRRNVCFRGELVKIIKCY